MDKPKMYSAETFILSHIVDFNRCNMVFICTFYNVFSSIDIVTNTPFIYQMIHCQ
jgi:hypothetical protein